MKKIFKESVYEIVFILFMILISACNQPDNSKKEKVALADGKATESIIKLYVSDDMFSLAEVWIKNFKLKNSNCKIDLIKSDTFNINEPNSLLVTNSYSDEYENINKIKIAKDIIVTIFNDNNPYIQKLVFQGVKPSELNELLFIGNINSWAKLVESQTGKEPIIIYRHNDNSGVVKAFKSYLKVNDKKMKGKILNNDNEIIENVKNNIMGLGFCSFNKAYTTSGNFRTQGIYILPIDKNSNGIVDDDEHIFDRKDILINAYKNGNYIDELTRNTYVFYNQHTKDKTALIFINWLLSEGQNYIEQFNLIPLSDKEMKEEKQKLGN